MEKIRKLTKTQKIIISIFSFILLVFCFLLLRNGNGSFMQLAGFEKELVEEIIYDQNGFPIIPEKFLACKKNRDCVLAADPCGTIAVHRSYKRKYDLWRKKAFSEYNFDCMNDLSYYKPQCVDFKCKEVEVEKDM